MKRKKITAGTRERRKHQAFRDLIWERVDSLLLDVQRRCTTPDPTKQHDHTSVNTARGLIAALRATGAK